MGSRVVAALLTALLPLFAVNAPAGANNPDPATAIRRLLAEFDTTERAANDAGRAAKTDAQRAAADQAMPDLRKYAQQFLDLAQQSADEAAAVDALTWVVGHGLQMPEGDKAVRLLADHHIRSERIGGACRALGAFGAEGEGLLRRIVKENPSIDVRGRACLALAYARFLRLNDASRLQLALVIQNKDPMHALERLHDIAIYRAEVLARAKEVEHWLIRVRDHCPGAVLADDITSFFGVLSEHAGSASEQILRRIAKDHPSAATRFEARCALVYHQMKLVSILAGFRAAAAKGGRAEELDSARVPEGEARLNALDATALVREIEQRLQELTTHANAVDQPGICFYHVIMDSPTLQDYYAGTETLLRRVAESHPSPPLRALARRSLALYLAGIRTLKQGLEGNRVLWTTRLGADRLEQIRQMDLDRLDKEVSTLAEQVVADQERAGRAPDPKIEALRKRPEP